MSSPMVLPHHVAEWEPDSCGEYSIPRTGYDSHDGAYDGWSNLLILSCLTPEPHAKIELALR